MMQQHRGVYFGETQKMLARALHDAGQTDREIADGCNTSVNNVIWWRKEEGLSEHLSAAERARAEEERYTPPVRRSEASRPPSAPAAPAGAMPSQMAPNPDPRLLTPAQAQQQFVAPVQPEGDGALEIGSFMDRKVFVDLEELLTTRLLVQGNSGSGKTHLLRKLLEESAGLVQQIIIDPEGDFLSFGPTFGHTIVEAHEHTAAKIARFAANARQLRGSVVLALEGLDLEQQMDAVTAFLGGLFDAAPEHWHPALVAIDEAHLFAPATDNGEDRETRKNCQQAMANLMCRGRKRGLAGIIATQRLSKLHKNVAAEASNFLLGRTFLDIDIARAADLLGMARADSEQVRDLKRGEFIGLGPAISRRPLKLTVGEVITAGKAGAPKGLTALPTLSADAMQNLMLAVDEEEPAATPALRVVK